MKPIKILLASMLVGVSAFSFAACSACDSLPTWLGGKEPTYKVVIHIDGMDTELEVTEDSIPEKPEDPVKEGYNFRGWYLDPAGTQVYNFDTPLNADSTLYAVFDEKEYVVTFVVDGVSEDVTFKWSETPSYETPKKDKYVFKTWCLDEELTQDYTFTAPVREALTVYAKFAEAYKVQYVVTPNVNEEEGDGVNTEIVETEKETAPIKPADPKVEGYTFEGWFLDKDFTQSYNFDEILTEGATIYAKLVEKQYVVTYMVGGTEDILSTVTYNYWDVPTEPATPEYQGEYFFGWYLDEEYTESYDFSYTLKEDTTVYAQFLESKPIYTADELQAIKDYPAGNYTLMNDINFLAENWTPIETFSGKLNGNGYRIYNFSILTTGALSGFVKTNNGTIRELVLDDFSFSQNDRETYQAGALVGVNNGTIEYCEITNAQIVFESKSSVTREIDVGALCGRNTATGTVQNCLVNNSLIKAVVISTSGGYARMRAGGAVGVNYGLVSKVIVKAEVESLVSTQGSKYYYGTSNLHLGGLISENYAKVFNCGYEGTINLVSEHLGKNSGYGYPLAFVGGLISYSGDNDGSSGIKGCYAKGSIVESEDGEGAEYLRIGGFIENSYRTPIQNCYAQMNISTESWGWHNRGTPCVVGGFIGANACTITNCFATGSISTNVYDYVGGFVSDNNGGIVKNSFCSVDIAVGANSQSAVGVFVGNEGTSSNILKSYYNKEVSVTDNGEEYVSAEVYGVTGVTAEELYSREILIDKLYWEEAVWVVDGVNAPTLAWEIPQE